MMLKIISGGQTGADRAALDAAIKHGVPCGGWCPDGRLAEDGPIPGRYPLQELKGGSYLDRTRQNVIGSDGTAIFHFGPLEGGTAATLGFSVESGKPRLLINAAEIPTGRAVELIRAFVSDLGVAVLNVAGPRASEEALAYPYAFAVVDALLSCLVGMV